VVLSGTEVSVLLDVTRRPKYRAILMGRRSAMPDLAYDVARLGV